MKGSLGGCAGSRPQASACRCSEDPRPAGRIRARGRVQRALLLAVLKREREREREREPAPRRKKRKPQERARARGAGGPTHTSYLVERERERKPSPPCRTPPPPQCPSTRKKQDLPLSAPSTETSSTAIRTQRPPHEGENTGKPQCRRPHRLDHQAAQRRNGLGKMKPHPKKTTDPH